MYVIPCEFALVAVPPGQRLHLLPVVSVQLLLELGDLGVVRPVESGLAGVPCGGEQLFEAAAERRAVRQLDVEFDAVVITAQRRQLVAVSLSQTLQLSTSTGSCFADTHMRCRITDTHKQCGPRVRPTRYAPARL